MHWEEGGRLTTEAFQEKEVQEQEAEARQFKYYWVYLLLQEEKRLNVSHIL